MDDEAQSVKSPFIVQKKFSSVPPGEMRSNGQEYNIKVWSWSSHWAVGLRTQPQRLGFHPQCKDPALPAAAAQVAAVAQIQSLAQELPCATGMALKKQKKKKVWGLSRHSFANVKTSKQRSRLRKAKQWLLTLPPFKDSHNKGTEIKTAGSQALPAQTRPSEEGTPGLRRGHLEAGRPTWLRAARAPGKEERLKHGCYWYFQTRPWASQSWLRTRSSLSESLGWIQFKALP